MKWFFLAALISACSQTPKEDFPKNVRITGSEIQSCRDYKQDVLDRGFKVDKDGNPEFTRDLNLAREVLAKFDHSQGLTNKSVGLFKNIIHECNDEAMKRFNEEYSKTEACVLIMHELQFFQGLAFALKKYPWPTDLQLEGKKVALDYIRYYAQGEYPLLNRLIALSALDELSVNQVVNESLHPEIKNIMLESQAYVQNLKGRFKQSRTLNCEKMDIVRDELAYSQTIAEKLRELLKRI